MSQRRVLVVDDEQNMRHMLTFMLKKENYEVTSAKNGKEALDALDKEAFDYILCDIRMPEMDGMAFLKAARKRHAEKTFIMMSAYGTVDTALEAIKEGAYDYISKPFKTDEVLFTLKKAEERERLKKENQNLKQKIDQIANKYSFGSIVARSEAMARVFDLVQKVAEHKTTVLITGESGTGKELIAKAIHDGGTRSSAPLVSINCGGIPENLIESELFGYKKGAFTDATRNKPGRFEEADRGTIFLDEIGELPFPVQVKLLRVLQEEEVTPLGGTGSRKIDVRVIAATSKNLRDEVEKKTFREDLFYRINVWRIHLPPLRDRKGDLSLLTGYFLDEFNRKFEKKVEGFSSEAMSMIMDYPWPGNVRELENTMERAVLSASGRLIKPVDLPQSLPARRQETDFPEETEILSIKKATRRLQRKLIARVLQKTEGNRTRAAKILEISRPMLISKIKEFGL